MTEPYEVVAAFADGERVNADALKHALADAAGRDYLVDVLALRGIVQASEPTVVGRRRGRSAPRRWLAAAAVLVAIVGGVFLTTKYFDRPPTPDRVVKLERGLDWRGN